VLGRHNLEVLLLQELRQMSAAGWKMTTRWTVVGTLCCVIFSVCFNAIIFQDLGPTAYNRGIMVAIILPILLAGPLFFFLTTKLRELSRLNHRLNDAVSVDHLTRVLNRGAFTDASKAAIKLLDRGGRSNEATNLFIVVDIDHFKYVNDKFGHPFGDKVLKAAADAMVATIRDHDLMGRLGGEEFGILLTHVSRSDAPYIMDRIRCSVSSLCLAHESKPIDLTVSVGGVVFSGNVEFNSLYKAADSRLYEAKKSGRNRTILAQMDHLGRTEKFEDANPSLDALGLAQA